MRAQLVEHISIRERIEIGRKILSQLGHKEKPYCGIFPSVK